MTAFQLAVKVLRGERLDTPVPHRWADAPPPAQVAKRAADAAGQGRRVSREDVPLLTNVVHWLYGIGWGVAYAGAADRLRPSAPAGGALLGGTVWATSYGELVPLGIQDPPWQYPLAELSLDLSYHLVYGAGVAGAVRLLQARSTTARRRRPIVGRFSQVAAAWNGG
jgi:uncharacterized membrane protein YagU involved in acid resistance